MINRHALAHRSLDCSNGKGMGGQHAVAPAMIERPDCSTGDDKKCILIVDDMAIIREPIGATLANAGYHVMCAGDGAAALAAVRERRPDLIVLDIAMPGMDGLSFLDTLRRAQPGFQGVKVIVLSASSDKLHIVRAARMGIHDYLLKSRFSLSDLIGRIKRHFEQGSSAGDSAPPGACVTPQVVSASGAGEGDSSPSLSAARTQLPSLTREQCIERAKSALKARTLSGVVAQVISMAASPRTDMGELATLLARDPMLAARVLQAANSACYLSKRGAVSTLPEAVRNIGCATVRDIAATCGVFDAMPPSSLDGFNPIRCWQHSFAVATLCQRLAGTGSDSGVAYLVGLCHDLGEILFQTHFGAEYRQVNETQAATRRGREEVERSMLGMTHGELVVTILRCLGLPAAILEPIEAFHRPEAAGPSPAQSMARVLRLADQYANGLLLASAGQSPIAPLTRSHCRAAVGEEHPPTPDAEQLRNEIYMLTSMLARLAPRDDAALMAPAYPRREVRVCLVRDSSLSKFDPVAAAIQSLADVVVRETLPGPEEWEDCRGLVVLSRISSAAGLGASDIQKSVGDRVPPSAVLWLSGRIDPDSAAPKGEFVATAWPVSLEQLGAFVKGLE
jgi:HD-like signal output (HDOD) protein/DNA-binding NarL/FixJ family response regulator